MIYHFNYLIFLTAIVFCTFSAFCQDTLYLVDGNMILAQENSTSKGKARYEYVPLFQNEISYVKKSEVLQVRLFVDRINSFYIETDGGWIEVKLISRQDEHAIFYIVEDSSKSEKMELMGKLLNRSEMQKKEGPFLYEITDTISIEKVLLSTVFKQKNVKLKLRDMQHIMSVCPDASTKIKKARTNSIIAGVFGFIGGVLIGWPVGEAIAGVEKPKWYLAGIGGGIIIATIPFSMDGVKSTKAAVKSFNKNCIQY